MGAFGIFKSKREKNTRPLTAGEYYEKLARRAKIATIALALATALLIIFAASAYSDELTVDNLRYMLKFIDTEKTETTENDVITYDSDDGNFGVLLRGNLAVCDSSGVSVYDMSSELLQTSQFRTEKLLTAVTDKHLLCCDLGGSELRAYSVYQTAYTETFEYPILGLAASKSGNYAVISSVKSYRSAVMIYNSYFRNIYIRKFGDRYASAVDISDDGKSFVTAVQYSAGSGETATGIYLFSISEEEPLATFDYDGELPLRVHMFSSGGFMLMTDLMLRFYNSDGELINAVDISALSPDGCVFGDDSVGVLYSTPGLSAGCDLVCYSQSGLALLKESFTTIPIDKLITHGHVYVLTRGVLTCYDLAGQDALTQTNVDTSCTHITADDEMLLLFSSDKSLVFKKFTNGTESEATT